MSIKDPAQWGGLGIVGAIAAWLSKKVVKFRPVEFKIVDAVASARITELEKQAHDLEVTITDLRVSLARLEPRPHDDEPR